MTFRVSRPALIKALLCTLILVFSMTFPLNAAHQVATNSDNPGSGFEFDGASADSTGGGQIGNDEDGDPTEIDQILSMLLTLSSAMKGLGL
jgi:hypothetical protein